MDEKNLWSDSKVPCSHIEGVHPGLPTSKCHSQLLGGATTPQAHHHQYRVLNQQVPASKAMWPRGCRIDPLSSDTLIK